MSNIMKVRLFEAASTTGGKVWGCIDGVSVITQTFSGTTQKFDLQLATTINHVKAKDVSIACNEKLRKGYIERTNDVWVDFDTGEVFWLDPDAESSGSSLKHEQQNIPPESLIAIAGNGLFTF